MLTNQILSYYNHLLATTVLYFSIVDPLQEISNTFMHNPDSEHQYSKSNLFVLANTDSNQEDYYKTLGVAKDATKHEIHKAFRQLAKKYHPDKNKEKGAQDEFIKIFKAYETLSDEKKRKEYDEASKGGFNHGSFNGWQSTNGMGDFDMNEFFKQYEDQFFRHTQHFSQDGDHHQHHHDHHNAHHFKFHGVNLDDLFHDIDEDELHSFGRMFDFHGHNHLHNDFDGTFGDGASFFGSHIPSQIHDTLHQYQHQQGHYNSENHRGGYSCQTITKQVNGMVMTQTSCT